MLSMTLLPLALVAAATAPAKASPAPAAPPAAGGPFEPVDPGASILVEGKRAEPARWSPSVDPRLERRYGATPYRPLNRITVPF